MTDEQLKRHIENTCAECEECYYYFNDDMENECVGQEEPCFEWQPKKKRRAENDT